MVVIQCSFSTLWGLLLTYCKDLRVFYLCSNIKFTVSIFILFTRDFLFFRLSEITSGSMKVSLADRIFKLSSRPNSAPLISGASLKWLGITKLRLKSSLAVYSHFHFLSAGSNLNARCCHSLQLFRGNLLLFILLACQWDASLVQRCLECTSSMKTRLSPREQSSF